MAEIVECGICGGRRFDSVWQLPKLPLTERFGPFAGPGACTADQEFVACFDCGHVQLRFQLDPEFLYGAHYAFRTAASPTAVDGVGRFLNFISDLFPDKKFNSLLDVGGNDLYLAKLFRDKARNRGVCDPICSAQHGMDIEGVRVIGKMIEDIRLTDYVPTPDIVICRHTLEHVTNPRRMLQTLLEQCDDSVVVAIEIPSLECLVEALRFDAVFHQHLHYYDLPALRRLGSELGLSYLGHRFNFQGSCGGALMIAFERATSSAVAPSGDCELPTAPQKVAFIKNRIAMYREQMAVFGQVLRQLPKPIFGYGAGLMLATLGYQLQTDFSELECILDDDPEKSGLSYENVLVDVRCPKTFVVPADSSFVITSLENVRPIYRRILDLKPRRILIPLIS